MNESQRRQINEARAESERKSYCIDATGRKSMGHSMPEHMQVERVEGRNEMPMYQKD